MENRWGKKGKSQRTEGKTGIINNDVNEKNGACAGSCMDCDHALED